MTNQKYNSNVKYLHVKKYDSAKYIIFVQNEIFDDKNAQDLVVPCKIFQHL